MGFKRYPNCGKELQKGFPGRESCCDCVGLYDDRIEPGFSRL